MLCLGVICIGLSAVVVFSIAAVVDFVFVDEAIDLIRFIDKEDGRLFFKAGGGITAQSDWQKEYQEIKEKTYVPIC